MNKLNLILFIIFFPIIIAFICSTCAYCIKSDAVCFSSFLLALIFGVLTYILTIDELKDYIYI